MQFTHEVCVTVNAPLQEIWPHWADIHYLPRTLSHLRAAALSDEDDLARLIIILDGRHIEFAAQKTMYAGNTICWQSVGPTFLYVLTVTFAPVRGGGMELRVNVAYDPPGFLPDIAESLGVAKSFRRTLDADLKTYACALAPREDAAYALAD
jgi:uncharacterized membrane protein